MCQACYETDTIRWRRYINWNSNLADKTKDYKTKDYVDRNTRGQVYSLHEVTQLG